MTVGERIKKIRQQNAISQTGLENAGKKSKQTLYKYENNIITNIPFDKIELIADCLSTSPSYIMGWAEYDLSNVKNIESMPEMVKVPLIGTIACGEPILAQENIEDYINMPEKTKGTFALRCKGDSMINARIFDGDIVFIREQPEVENGEIAAVLIDDEATLKRVYKTEFSIELRPENPTYKSLYYQKDEMNKVRILGKAVGFYSNVL